MSDSDRREGYSTGLIVALCFVLLAGGVVGVSWLWEQKVSYQQARTYSGNHEPTEASGICLKLPPVAIGCAQENNSEAQDNRDDDDLKAQQEMADWAFWMVLFTAGGLTLSTIGVVLIFATFRATRAQLAEAAKQTTLDRLRSQARITVKIKGGVIHYFGDPDIKPFFHLIIENSGDTDASDVTVTIEGWLPDERQEGLGFGKFRASYFAGYVYRKQSHPPATAVVSDGYVLPEGVIAAIRAADAAKPVRAKIAVTIDWIDVFEDRQVSGPFVISGQLNGGGSPDHVHFAPAS